MRIAVCLCLCVLLVATSVGARRSGGGGGRRGGFSSSRHKTPAPPPRRTDTSSSSHFLNFERGSSAGSGTTHNRGNPFNTPSAPQPPKPPPLPQTTGPIGFERFGGATNQGNQKIGFDKVNSDVSKPGGSHVPSAPPYPGGSHVPSAPQYPGGNPPNGPPPAYYPGTHSGNSYGGVNDHPPAYPGRPVNAPPSYSSGNPQFGQTNPSQPGFGSNYPGQHNYQGQSYPGQQQFGNPNTGSSFGNTFPQQNQYGNPGHGSYQAFGGSSYPGNTGSYPGYGGNSFGGGSPFGNSYQGNAYGGSPFAGAGYNGNPHYSPNNFGYSSNPGYFGPQSPGYPGQYDNYQKKSRFGGLGGLPIPIPIPIPIPFGGGGFGGGFGGFGGHSYNHRLLDTFIKSKNTTSSGNSSTSVFILNNSTVTPCTTDHFVYDLLRVTVVSCTAEFCTAIKVSSTTNISSEVSVHSAGLTMCLEQNATYSHYGDNISPSVTEIQRETVTVCRDVPNNMTVKVVNETTKSEEITNTTTLSSVGSTVDVETTTTDATTTQDTTTTEGATTSSTLLNDTLSNTSKVCEPVDCYWVEMCLPAIEIVDQCNTVDCPFRRTGYKSCVRIKMCRSPSTPLSTFASINTTVSKIDEYNHHNSVYDAANLTLISYHRPVISFNCSQNSTAPGCPPPPGNSPQSECVPANSTLPTTGSTSPPVANITLCSPIPTTPLATNSTGVAVANTEASSTPPP